MHPLQWLGRHDRDLVALRRAGRAAIVMPAAFALGKEVIGNPVIATFAAFGSFALLLLVDFGGPLRERLQAQALLALVGCALVCLGTLVSRSLWLSSGAMALVGFGVIFAGVVSSVLATASTSLLLAFILPVTLAGSPSAIPDRVAGWGIAAGASLLAVGLLWPAPMRSPLRMAAVSACRGLAARLRAEAAFTLSDGDPSLEHDRDHAVAHSQRAVAALHGAFLATPYRPTGLSTSSRTIVRLVDEVNWLNAVVVQSPQPAPGAPTNHAACAVKVAAAAVLDRGAEVLSGTGEDCGELKAAMADLGGALDAVEERATVELPVARTPREAHKGEANGTASELITSLDSSFRAQELSFAVSQIGANIDLTAAAERRTWLQRLLGRQPQGLSSRRAAAQERAGAHVDLHSVWLHNSIRGAIALGLAVFVANRTGVQHSFWVVLGTLSVLRSSALNTGQNVARGLLGTAIGFIVGGALVAVIGTNATVLWLLLPAAILLAGVAPAAIGFAAGQAGFTLTLVILFNIIQPAGWKIGLLRVEDIAIGCAVSLLVGLLFWPRGAAAALRRALAEAYSDSAAYLASAVDFGMRRCDFGQADAETPARDAARAAAASRRLDDTFRSYLAESGAKPVPLEQMTSLVTGAGGLRLAADAVLDMWEREDGSPSGDRTAARHELLQTSTLVSGWFEDFAGSLAGAREPREPLARDKLADARLLAAVRHDLRGEDGKVSATAVRMVWTGDHLDAVRRLQARIAGPARAATERTQAPLLRPGLAREQLARVSRV